MTTVDELKEKIKIAETSVQDVVDETLRTKAFEVILNNLLAGTEKTEPNKQTEQEATRTVETAETNFDTSKLVEATSLSLEELSTVFDFTNNDFRIIANILGENEGDKQRNAALILLTANFYCRTQREMLAADLRDAMKDLGIASLVNMATNLGVKSYRSYFVRDGDQGSKNTKYRITTPGIQKGLELIRNLERSSAS